MANNNFRTAPKRRIEKVNSRLNHTITNSVSTKTLHTVEDRKTLVRTIVQLNIQPNGSAGAFTIVLERLPRGNSVGTPATTESLDSDMIKEQMWHYTGVHGATATETIVIEVDNHGMRKLDPGDEVTLKTIGAASNQSIVAGNVTLFFKE